jgi:hypothetical protein
MEIHIEMPLKAGTGLAKKGVARFANNPTRPLRGHPPLKGEGKTA